MSDDDSFDSLEELPPPPPFDEEEEEQPMGRNTTADLESLLDGFKEERFSKKPQGGSGDTLDYAQLDAFLGEGPTASPGGKKDRYSEFKSRNTINSFVQDMEYAVSDEEEEIEVKPKNAKKKNDVSKTAPSKSSERAAPSKREEPASSNKSGGGGGKYHNPVVPPQDNARLGPTYPMYSGTPVTDARRPKREKAIEMETRAKPQVFMVDNPEEHIESNVYFSGTVSFNDPHAADVFLQTLTDIVNRSAVVFHEIKADNPGAARDLDGLIEKLESMLHHFTEAADEEGAKTLCDEGIKNIKNEVRGAHQVLRTPPPKGEMWAMDDNQKLASSLKAVFNEVCGLMKVSEREQAQQFMVVVKTCFDTIENILNSHKRHAGIYFEHLKGYVNDHLYPLLDNRIETTPDKELQDQYRAVKSDLKLYHPQFKAFMDAQWPANAHERAKTAASYDEKREGAAPFYDALKRLEDILKTLLNPISDFELRFNLPRKPLEEITQNLIRASARQDKNALLESTKQLQTQLKELPPDDPHVADLRMSSRDLVEHAKKVFSKQEQPEQMQLIVDKMLATATEMEEEQVNRQRSSGVDQHRVDALAVAVDRMSLIAVDPMRVSHVEQQSRISHQIQVMEPQQHAPPLRISHQIQVMEPQQHAPPLRISATDEQAALDVLRKNAARVSSRASVVVQLATKRGQGNKKARQELYEASDKVAQALKELADLESSPQTDINELQRLIDEVDQSQAQLFTDLPPPTPSDSRTSTTTKESVRKSVQRASQVVTLYERAKGNRTPNEKLIVAAEKVAETLEELGELESSAADDELNILVEEATKHQKELIRLTKDPKNFVDDDIDEFMNDFDN